MRARAAGCTAVFGLLLVAASGCGASLPRPTVPLSIVRASRDTPAALAALLRRPVRVPESCRLTKAMYLTEGGWNGWTLGRRPLRAVVDRLHDTAQQSFKLEPADARLRGWWYSKVLWLAPRKYHGWLLVRGVGLDHGSMGFLNGSDRPRSALTLADYPTPREPPSGQRYSFWTTATLVPRLGCYAYQVDGRSFSYSIIVGATR